MNEVVLFALTIAAVGIAGIYGIVNGRKHDEQKLLSQENTDSVRGLAICMIMTSHMAQSVAGGVY